MRCGKNGSHIDNRCSGGICVGLDNNGVFTGKSTDGNLKVSDQMSNGPIPTGERIPCFDRIVALATEMHPRMFPMLHLAGWDFALDADGLPIVIEINFGHPGTLEQQILSGPFFGDRTEEVIDYVLGHLKETSTRKK